MRVRKQGPCWVSDAFRPWLCLPLMQGTSRYGGSHRSNCSPHRRDWRWQDLCASSGRRCPHVSGLCVCVCVGWVGALTSNKCRSGRDAATNLMVAECMSVPASRLLLTPCISDYCCAHLCRCDACSRTAETGGVAERMAGGVEDMLNSTPSSVVSSAVSTVDSPKV